MKFRKPKLNYPLESETDLTNLFDVDHSKDPPEMLIPEKYANKGANPHK